jgi:hypothetical protein
MVKRAFFFFFFLYCYCYYYYYYYYYFLFLFLNVAFVVAVLDLISGIHLLESVLVHLCTVIASYFWWA